MRLNWFPWRERPYGLGAGQGAKRKPVGWASKRLRKQRISRASRKRNRANYGKPKAKHA